MAADDRAVAMPSHIAADRTMEFPRRIPFVDTLGCELLRLAGGEAEIALELRAELCNSLDVAHGGVTMTLLDVAMAHAARSGDAAAPRHAAVGTEGGDGTRTDAGRGVVTIEMKTSFMRPASGRLLARGRLLTRTASLAFCEGSVVDAAGRLLAHATGTFKYLTDRSSPAAPSELTVSTQSTRSTESAR